MSSPKARTGLGQLLVHVPGGQVDGLAPSPPLQRQLDNFIDVILGLAEPVVTAFDGTQNVRVAEAIQRSAATRSLIELAD